MVAGDVTRPPVTAAHRAFPALLHDGGGPGAARWTDVGPSTLAPGPERDHPDCPASTPATVPLRWLAHAEVPDATRRPKPDRQARLL